MKRKRMILMVMLMKMVSMISMILFQTMVWASMRVIVVIVVRTYVCMLLLMMLALVFSHPTRHETMKLLLASATSLVTRVAYGRLENCQAQRANQASDSSLPISMVYVDGGRVIPLQRITWGRIGTNPCLCLL